MSSGQVPGRRRTGRQARPRGLLIAAEGLDGSGKSATLEGLARWLERRGRPVVTIAWRPSELVARAVLNPRSRPALTPRVAALLAAADAQARIAARIERRLAAGTTVLADRYAWTAIAREVARGLEPDWSANLHAVLPAPDLVVYHRSHPGSAVEQALAGRPASVRSAAVGAAYGEFVGRLLLAYETLVADAAQPAGTDQSRPWPTRLLVLAAGSDPAANARLADAALDELVESRPRGRVA
jgi:dTMP kinase